MAVEYHRRIVDLELIEKLKSVGAVVLEGPKACGKTATARNLAASEVLLDVDESARKAIGIEPSLILHGATPRLIDEWQIEPAIWNYIRRSIDDRGVPGQFILTGSAVPVDDISRHSGAGRISRLRMRTMSLFESGMSTGTVSLSKLLEGDFANAPDEGMDLRKIADQLAIGGWPGLIGRDVQSATRAVRDYIEEISRLDIINVDHVRRDPVKVKRLLMSLARNIGSCVTVRTLTNDVGGQDEKIDEETVRSYLKALERIFVVEDQHSWAPHLRSKSILRSSAKRHFIDPSLALAAMNAGAERLLMDLSWFGFLFESLVVRDLRIYAQGSRSR